MESTQARHSTCVVVGGGPAGMMAGLLFARAGIEVTVIEKHDDFFRDFRGDTIHPSTLDLLHELGMLEDFLTIPHTKVPQLGVNVGNRMLPLVDFRHLPTVCKFMLIMPQWDFLNFLAERAWRYPNFHLEMGMRATGLVMTGDRVVGVRAQRNSEKLTYHSDLVVAADGRDSTIRPDDLPRRTLGAPIDVLWWRVPKSHDAGPTMGYLHGDQIMLTIDRGAYYQCGAIIPKGGFDAVKAAGLDTFRETVVRIAPVLKDGIDEVRDWEDVKLLSVQVNRLKQWWRPGLLHIGDAAHAMSPAGGVGVNYALQDAVATANQVAAKLRDGRLRAGDLRKVQRRRYWPVALMQRIQVQQAKRLVPLTENQHRAVDPERLLAVVSAIPLIKRVIGRIVGLGFRREHIASPAA